MARPTALRYNPLSLYMVIPLAFFPGHWA
jgi:hypothetical protein